MPDLLHLRLIHDGTQPGPPLPEPLLFGLQDSKGEVHPGLLAPCAPRNFDLEIAVTKAADGAPLFRGAFAHGPPAARFLYLSWKRIGTHEHPWGWRIKMPLSGIGWADIVAVNKPGKCLVADVLGRKPHDRGAVEWRVEAK